MIRRSNAMNVQWCLDRNPIWKDIMFHQFTKVSNINVQNAKLSLPRSGPWKITSKKFTKALKYFWTYKSKLTIHKPLKITLVNIGIKHFGKNDALDCKDCNKQVTHESDLKIHENIAPPKFNFHCDKCDKRFVSKCSMNLHVQTMHSNSKRDLKYKCLISKVPKGVFLSKGHMDGKTRQNGSWKNQELQMWKLR